MRYNNISKWHKECFPKMLIVATTLRIRNRNPQLYTRQGSDTPPKMYRCRFLLLNYTFLPIGNFTKSFCGFTSRKGNVAREEALRIANTDRTRRCGNGVAFACKSHDQRCPPSCFLLSGHAQVTEKPKSRRNTARFLTVFIL